MRIVGDFGIAFLVVLLFLVLLYTRRTVLSRGGGTIGLSVRLSTLVPGRGWSPGVGRFVGDELRWYRLFSLSMRPRRVLSRRALAVEGRRTPDDREQLVLPENCAIVRCAIPSGPVEIAMAGMTLAGFLSWLEAAPPGAISGPSPQSRIR